MIYRLLNLKKIVYTQKKIAIPQYSPSKIKPQLESLIDYNKYSQLIKSINNSNVSEGDKKFLKFAATRHLVFHYSKIADYYAHSSAEMQKLMEESALVILDIDDAIVNGYVRLSNSIDKLLNNGGQSEVKR